MDEKRLAYSKLEISLKIKNKKNYFNEITFGRKSLTLTTVRPSLQLRRRMDEKGLVWSLSLPPGRLQADNAYVVANVFVS